MAFETWGLFDALSLRSQNAKSTEQKQQQLEHVRFHTVDDKNPGLP